MMPFAICMKDIWLVSYHGGWLYYPLCVVVVIRCGKCYHDTYHRTGSDFSSAKVSFEKQFLFHHYQVLYLSDFGNAY